MYHTLLHPAFSSGQSNSVLCTDTKSVIRLYTLSEHTTCHRVSLSVHILANLTSQCVYFASLRPGSTIRFHLLLRRCKYRHRHVTHPLFIQFEELLSDFGRAERQSQTGHVELGNDLFQDLLERQTTHRAVPPRGRHGIL